MGQRKACPTGHIAFKRACGHQQAIVLKCKSPLCPTCERERVARVVKRWTPVLNHLPELKLMTLTVKNSGELKPSLKRFDKSFRRLLDLRIGRNNRARLKRLVFANIEHKISIGRIKPEDGSRWKESTLRWLDYVTKVEAKIGKSFKIRKLLKGLSSLEVTFNTHAQTWHPHRHLIVSMKYIPQIVLSALWHWATHGEGEIVHIRKAGYIRDAMAETIKYSVKGFTLAKGEDGTATETRVAIPEDKEEELLKALKGKKRVWPIGKIRPVPEEPAKCPGCDSTECKCERVAILSNDQDAVIPNQTYIAGNADKPYLIVISRDDKNRLVWTTKLLAGDLSRNPQRFQEKGDHDPPQGAPSAHVWQSADLRIQMPLEMIKTPE